MTGITTRAGKGSALTYNEMDSNFTNLNTDKIEVASILTAPTKATLVDNDVLTVLDSAASYILNKTTWYDVKSVLSGTFILTTAIGVSVQPYDANTAKTNIAQNYTKPQRSSPTADNDYSFDLSLAQNFTCTPTVGGMLTFTNVSSGQSGFILFNNTTSYAVTKDSMIKCDSTLLTTISTTGLYLLSYYIDGTTVYLTTTKAVT